MLTTKLILKNNKLPSFFPKMKTVAEKKRKQGNKHCTTFMPQNMITLRYLFVEGEIVGWIIIM